jgi:hypothetical protein
MENTELTMDDLLRLDDSADGFNEKDLWDLEQKLISPNKKNSVEPSPAMMKGDTPSISQSTVEHDVLSALRHENIMLRQELDQLKRFKDSTTVESTTPSTDDLLQRIQELESITGPDASAKLLERMKCHEKRNRELETENEQLKESLQSASKSLDLKKHVDQEAEIVELKGIVTNLQSRIMVLVEEKLDLQLRYDGLEHELKTWHKDMASTQHRMPWFSLPSAPSKDEGESERTILKDRDASQSDFLKVAIAKKKKRDLTIALGGILSKVSFSEYANPGGLDEGEHAERTATEGVDEKSAQHEFRSGPLGIGMMASHEDFDKSVEEFRLSSHQDSDVSPSKKSGGWSLFGSHHFRGATASTQGDEDEFMSSPTTGRGKQYDSQLPPALTMDTLPSILDSEISSGDNSANGDGVINFEAGETVSSPR